MQHKNYKTLKGKHRQNTLWHKSEQDPLWAPPRIMEIKAKINKWDLIKPKTFCPKKETINKVKRKPSEWEKIIAYETIDKGLISKIYKQFIQLIPEKQTAQSKGGQKS